MSVTVDHDSARTALRRAWKEIGAASRPPGKMRRLIESVLGAPDVTFKYILATGYLAKEVNPAAHARALQVGSSLDGAYDARSLCHKVVVGFEKSKGNLFGLSNEPFVNKPARHAEHDGKNPQLRNKAGAQTLHHALEQAQRASAADVHRGLVHILRLGSRHAANEQKVAITTEVNLGQVTGFIECFLRETDGGCRLAGVWGAFLTLLSESGEIKVYSPNASDQFGKTAGDVEVYYGGTLVSASECKQRPLNLDDVNHGIRKSLERGLSEYVFVIASGIAAGQDAAISKALLAHGKDLDLALVDIRKEAGLLAALLNPRRRAQFGAVVAALLRRMRKFDSANAAARLWNQLTGQV